MADTKSQTSTERERERGLERRQESSPWREPWRDYSPFSLMRRLSDEMDRAFSSSFGLNRWFGESGMWTPAIDVRELNGNVEITAELPGMNKEDVQVECTEEGVIIQGEKRRETEKEEGGVRRTERSYGRFYRAIPLPEGAKTDQAKAEFKNGILEIRVPVPEHQRKARQIPISS
jgi:HSP20 family protein